MLVVIGRRTAGTGMEETYQLTSALKFLPWGKTVPILTDGRFSGVSTGVRGPHRAGGAGGWSHRPAAGRRCHRHGGGPENAGGADQPGGHGRRRTTPDAAQALLHERAPHPDLAPHPELPDDTRLWAALQQASGGTWGGCVYDVDRIVACSRPGWRRWPVTVWGENGEAGRDGSVE
ncbi:MAG: hypothetical protein R2838_25165 [Caldilineaceae bacterium]